MLTNRILGHIKASAFKNVTKRPTRSDGKDGDVYVYKGILFIKHNYEWHEYLPKSVVRVSRVGDLVYTGTITASALLNLIADLDTLKQKINKIIEALDLDIRGK